MNNSMNDKKEIWDLYDRDGNRTGETFVRDFGNYKTIPEGRYHIVVDLLVIHTDGTFLLTKRSEEKDVYPGCWEAVQLSAGKNLWRLQEENCSKRQVSRQIHLNL